MMVRFIGFVLILIIPAFVVSVNASDEIPDLDDLLIWAFTSPREEPCIDGLIVFQFHSDLQKIREEYLIYHNSSNVTGAIQLLKDNVRKSTIDWADVFARIQMKKESKKGEHGLPSLVAWALHETGPGTQFPTIKTEKLIKFLVFWKTGLTIYLRRGKLKSIIDIFNKYNYIYSSSSVDWNPIIYHLKEHGQLLKYACGLFNLQLCDTAEK